jgi:hypothetical protein
MGGCLDCIEYNTTAEGAGTKAYAVDIVATMMAAVTPRLMDDFGTRLREGIVQLVQGRDGRDEVVTFQSIYCLGWQGTVIDTGTVVGYGTGTGTVLRYRITRQKIAGEYARHMHTIYGTSPTYYFRFE